MTSGVFVKSLRKIKLVSLHFENLAAAVSSAGRAGDVGWDGCTAIGAGTKDRCFPAVRAAAHFLAAFGLTAFWYGHGRY